MKLFLSTKHIVPNNHNPTFSTDENESREPFFELNNLPGTVFAFFALVWLGVVEDIHSMYKSDT